MENQISEEILKDLDKVDALLKHIQGVQTNCIYLGKRLIRDGKNELGRILIANSLKHDHSKFFGTEWDFLSKNDIDESDAISLILRDQVIKQHNHTNPHHPEYWGGVKNMPSVYIAEMVCDWKARSSEFGSDLVNWIEEVATKRFEFDMEDEVGEKIKYYLSLLIEKSF